MSAPTHEGPDLPPSARWPRATAGVLVALLAAHAALVAIAIARGTPGPVDLSRYAVIAAGAAAFGLLSLRWPHRTASAALAGCVAVAAVVVGPAAAAVVALMLANAAVVGAAFIAWASRLRPVDILAQGLAMPTLAGMALWLGLMSATAGARVHVPVVYGAMLILPLVAWPGSLVAIAERARRWHDAGRWTADERWWIVALAVIATVHVFVVAKPEIGYDASTMHLQFAEMMAKDRRWAHDVTRYAWAVMPLGADHAFAAAYLLGGEAAARLFNLAAGAIACTLLCQLGCRVGTRGASLAVVALFASAPLAFVESGSLFSEPLWLAFLLATLLAALDPADVPDDAPNLVVLALAAAGAMQAKVIGVLWLGPLAVGLAGVLLARRRAPRCDGRAALAIGIAALIAAWPYANAWIRTGNPVFPYLNAFFRSPYFAAGASFNNPFYNAPLRWSTPYEIVLGSARFLEGHNGSAGFHWLLAYPVVALAAIRFRDRTVLAVLLLAATFFVGVFTQQSYLRYLLPAFALLTMAAAHALSTLPRTHAWTLGTGAVGTLLVFVNLHFIAAGGFAGHTLCMRCLLDPSERDAYVFANAPLRTVSAVLNHTMPDGRVAFLVVNGPSPAGFTGYSRSANWHDDPFYQALIRTTRAEDVLALVRRYQLEFAVFDVSPGPQMMPAISDFRARYTTPVWRRGDYVIARIAPAPPAGTPGG